MISIHLVMESKVLEATIRQVFSSPGKQKFVDTTVEADKIIFDSFDLVKDNFDSNKPYACMTGIAGINYPASMPPNVTRITFADVINQMIDFLKQPASE